MSRRAKIEFGDFQTPSGLALAVCDVLQRWVAPRSVVEPTCGKGSFLRAAVAAFPECERFLGFEINPEYAQSARTVTDATIRCVDFFDQDWPSTLGCLPEPVLVVGNPPWVTNSTIGALGGSNLPAKSNFRRLNGLDAVTGKSNFDISEWILAHLLESLSGREAVLAMLCKTTVARKVLHHAWNGNLQIANAKVFLFNAVEHFGASVDACLLVCVLAPGAASRECAVYPTLDASSPSTVFAYRHGQLVADLDAYDTYGHLSGSSPLRWRSGIKHDCARVIELWPEGDGHFRNGFGEVVRLETDYLYPMLKSSDLAKPVPGPTRYMLVTQHTVGADTSRIAQEAPHTWSYLQSHGHLLDRRASSIYRDRSRFSIFGVGPYSFSPWKVATSGFYKQLAFRCVGPADGKPVVLDDTCYFLPCHTQRDSELLTQLLNSRASKGFFRSRVFWDAKRPITAQLLKGLDLGALADQEGVPLPVWSDRGQLSLAGV